MFEALFVIGLVGLVLALPLMLVGLVVKLAFKIILLPLHLLGALIGVGVVGLVLVALGIAFGAVVGALALTGLLFSLGPLLVLGLVIWVLFRVLRGGKGSRTTA